MRPLSVKKSESVEAGEAKFGVPPLGGTALISRHVGGGLSLASTQSKAT